MSGSSARLRTVDALEAHRERARERQPEHQRTWDREYQHHQDPAA
jgi:hypothetical protein